MLIPASQALLFLKPVTKELFHPIELKVITICKSHEQGKYTLADFETICCEDDTMMSLFHSLTVIDESDSSDESKQAILKSLVHKT